MTTLEIILIVALIYLVIAILLIGINGYTGLVELDDVLVCLAWCVTIWIFIIQIIQRKIKRKIRKREEN